ncbi:MAG: HAD-IB family phosphatase [Deltaproteobacteria bacterium]|nr:HAD-IB family phosphatase [Deltaproteobacteria bacterium]
MPIVTDFDYTLTTIDVGDALCDRFAPPEWHAIDDRWQRGEVSLPAAQREIWSLLRATAAAVRDFVATTARLRPGVPEFFRACRERALPVYVGSGGFDFYLEPLLEPHRPALAGLYCSRGVFHGDRLALQFLTGLECPSCAVCKGRLCDLARAAHPGERLVFLGDGASDRCAIGHADLVLAVRGSQLAERCAAHGRQPFATFDDFFEVMRLGGLG